MHDCSLGFAHAVWQGSKVAVFLDGGYCGRHKVAFDLSTERPARFSSLEPLLRASIIESYSVSAQELAAHNGDVFHWATYQGDGRPSRGNMEFRERWRR